MGNNCFCHKIPANYVTMTIIRILGLGVLCDAYRSKFLKFLDNSDILCNALTILAEFVSVKNV